MSKSSVSEYQVKPAVINGCHRYSGAIIPPSQTYSDLAKAERIASSFTKQTGWQFIVVSPTGSFCP